MTRTEDRFSKLALLFANYLANESPGALGLKIIHAHPTATPVSIPPPCSFIHSWNVSLPTFRTGHVQFARCRIIYLFIYFFVITGLSNVGEDLGKFYHLRWNDAPKWQYFLSFKYI